MSNEGVEDGEVAIAGAGDLVWVASSITCCLSGADVDQARCNPVVDVDVKVKIGLSLGVKDIVGELQIQESAGEENRARERLAMDFAFLALPSLGTQLCCINSNWRAKSQQLTAVCSSVWPPASSRSARARRRRFDWLCNRS